METNKVIDSLDNWFQKNKYYGHDIYDLFDVPIFHTLITNKPLLVRKVLRKFISSLIFLFPTKIIGIFKIKTNQNSKGMGLLLKAYCNLYVLRGEDKYKNCAIEIAEWLINNNSKDIKGYGWGYPFDWSGTRFIPKNTPSSVVSTIIGDGFIALYDITKNEKYLTICNGICDFILFSLNTHEVDSDSLCFSYTPIDNDHVINANLFCAEFLVRMGVSQNNQHYINLGRKALNYCLKHQLDSGDILYWGGEDRIRLKYSRSNSDHYHSGFELRMLHSLYNLLKTDNIKKAFDKYYNYYLKNYINDDYSINLLPLIKYPINIHGCAEAILCNSIIKDDRVNMSKLIEWIFLTMLDSDGLFKYEIRKYLFIKVSNKYKFMRWSQAWMFLALTELLKHYMKNKE